MNQIDFDKKTFTLSVNLPQRNDGLDIERSELEKLDFVLQMTINNAYMQMGYTKPFADVFRCAARVDNLQCGEYFHAYKYGNQSVTRLCFKHEMSRIEDYSRNYHLVNLNVANTENTKLAAIEYKKRVQYEEKYGFPKEAGHEHFKQRLQAIMKRKNQKNSYSYSVLKNKLGEWQVYKLAKELFSERIYLEKKLHSHEEGVTFFKEALRNIDSEIIAGNVECVEEEKREESSENEEHVAELAENTTSVRESEEDWD